MLGIVGLVLAALSLVPIGLAIWNVAQAIRMASDPVLPTFIRAIVVEANGRRVLAFSLVAALLAAGSLGVSLAGRRSLVAKIALGLAGLELVSLLGVGVASRKIPSAAELRARAASERAADEDAKRAAASPPTTPSAAQPAPPAPSDREVAFQLGLVLGSTVLARTNGAPPEVVERQRQRGVVLAHALDLEVAPYPALTGRKLDDVSAGMAYLLDGSGKDLIARVRASRGEREAALLELGMKMGVMRFMYMPRGRLNSAFVSVLDRTGKAAQLETPTVRATATKIKANAPRTDVYTAIDAMETAIKNELAAGPAAKPVEPDAVPVNALRSSSSGTARPASPSPSSSSSSPARGASVREGAPSTSGRLPPEVIQRSVRANMGRFRSCYERGLASNPALEGRVAVKFVIDRSGAVSTAADDGSTLPDPSVVQCIVRQYSSMSFPAPEGGTVTVRYPLDFRPSR